MKSYFETLKFLLRLCGISLNNNETTSYKILSRIPFFIACLYPFIAAGNLYKYNKEKVIETLTYEIPLLVGVIKAVAVLINCKKIAKLLSHLDGNLSLRNFVNGDKRNEKIMETCILVTAVQTTVYSIMTWASVSMGIVITLVIRIRSTDYHDWQFPYGEFSIVNITHGHNFEILWAYQCMSATYIATLFMTIDLLMATILCHICFHLRILQNNLKTIVEKTYKKMKNLDKASKQIVNCTDNTETLSWNNLHEPLKEQVEYHLGIINTVKQADEVFSTLLLLIFAGTLGMQAFMVYKASLVPLNDVRFLRHLAELSCAILQVAMVCYWGEEMVWESARVGTLAYEANFVGTDLRFQKSLILIIRRSQYPIKLTAGYVNVSFAAFTWILRSAYSYFMLLRRFNSKDNY